MNSRHSDLFGFALRGMLRLGFGLLLLAMAVSARAQYVAPYVILQGTLTTAGGTPAQNATLNFAPNQLFFVSGTSVVVSAAQCSTDASGAVVGVPNPVSGPRVSAQYTGTLPAGNYYVRFTWYDQFGNQTLPSVEVAQQLTGAGELQILPPAGAGPPTATGMDVYIGASPGAETYQGQTTSLTAQFTQAAPITTVGAAVPIRNGTACRVVANDAGWPTGTGYQVSLTDASGNTLFNYAQLWQFLGPGSTYNLSSGIPYYNGQVTYPVPVLTQPYNHNPQSISGPLYMGQPGGVGYNIAGVAELGVGTWLPAYGVDVEGSGLAGEINAVGGYLVNGAAGTTGQCLTSNGTVYNTPANCVTSIPTLYYQTVEANGTPVTQEAALNFSANLAVATVTGATDVDLAHTAVTAGTYTNPTLTVDAYGRLTAASNGTSGIQVYDNKPLASPVSLSASVAGTLDSITVAAAGGGAPAFPSAGSWRVLVCYSYYGAAGEGVVGESRVTDSASNIFAASEGGQFSADGGTNYQACGLSPVTYSGSAAETFTVSAENIGSQTIETTSPILANPSGMSVAIFPSN